MIPIDIWWNYKFWNYEIKEKQQQQQQPPYLLVWHNFCPHLKLLYKSDDVYYAASWVEPNGLSTHCQQETNWNI